MTTEQVFGDFGDQNRTCGIGAAQVAFGDNPGSYELVSILSRQMCITLPCCSSIKSNMRDAIIHMNDIEKWPRQKIADWLESEGL